MNKISIVGRIVADAEMRFTQSGEGILQFRVADDIGYGEKKTTNWWQCSIWGKRAEALQSYIAKGQKVTVFGQAVMREWVNKDGIKQLSPEVRVDEIDLGTKPEAHAQVPKGRGMSQTERIADDIPF